jgi:hypothetical protein
MAEGAVSYGPPRNGWPHDASQQTAADRHPRYQNTRIRSVVLFLWARRRRLPGPESRPPVLQVNGSNSPGVAEADGPRADCCDAARSTRWGIPLRGSAPVMAVAWPMGPTPAFSRQTKQPKGVGGAMPPHAQFRTFGNASAYRARLGPGCLASIRGHSRSAMAARYRKLFPSENSRIIELVRSTSAI